jgi:hypothetical protein
MTGQPNLDNEQVLQAQQQNHHHHHNTKQRHGFFGGSGKQVSEAELDNLVTEMVNGLTEEEKEHAARASYKYLWKSVTSTPDTQQTKEFLQERDSYAKEMAMRFLKSKKGNTGVAMEKLRNAITFRKEMDIDGLRLCFQADQLHLDVATAAKYATYREKLSERMTTGRVFTCGYDKQGRAIYTIYAARTKDFDQEWFIKESIFNFEKALACTEVSDRQATASCQVAWSSCCDQSNCPRSYGRVHSSRFSSFGLMG